MSRNHRSKRLRQNNFSKNDFEADCRHLPVKFVGARKSSWVTTRSSSTISTRETKSSWSCDRVAPPSATAGELRSFLAKFLFTGDDVYKHVRDLSGGEKGRLALAKLIYSRVNVLVLDEPTNHLDIPSREALEEALDAYEGTILTISHDRYFLDRVATQILALDGEGNAEHYDGDYTEYHDWKLSRLKGEATLKSTQASELVSASDWAHTEESPGLRLPVNLKGRQRVARSSEKRGQRKTGKPGLIRPR